MTLPLIGIAYVVCGDALESIGQASFKRATHRVREGDTHVKAIRRIFKNWPWILAGILLCLMNNMLYTLGLWRLSLTLAYPLQSLELVMMALLCRAFLGEAVGKRRWLATALILAGSILVTASG